MWKVFLEKAVVIQKINNLAQTGQVRINDIEWMARTSDDSVTIPVDTGSMAFGLSSIKEWLMLSDYLC